MQAKVILADQFVDDLQTATISNPDTGTWLIRELAREVQRLRKLAPWHDTPRVRITQQGTHFGLEGHLLRSIHSNTDDYDPEYRIILDGHTDAEWWDVADVEIISQPEEPTNGQKTED